MASLHSLVDGFNDEKIGCLKEGVTSSHGYLVLDIVGY